MSVFHSVPDGCFGLRVESANFDDSYRGVGGLQFVFENGATLVLSDRGPDCCNSVYMTCSDDLSQIVGDRMVGVTIEDAPDISGGEDAYHEVQFLHVRFASGAVVVCETHNEHNGYYGGFSLVVEYEGGS